MSFVGEVQIPQGRFEPRVSEVARDEAKVDASFESMGGVGMPEGRDGAAGFGKPGALFGGAEGALDAGARPSTFLSAASGARSAPWRRPWAVWMA